MHTAWQVEQDPFCRAVLAKHFPGAQRHDDVCTVGAHNLEPVDLICGGFPCQDISLAGKGAGIAGARSGLWGEMWRIVDELRPRWVVVENVPALTSRGLDRVLRDLAEGGYDAEWDCIPASALGAPHRRDRIWLVAYPQCTGPQGLGADAGQPEVAEPRHGGALADPEGQPERAGLRESGARGQRGRRPGDGGGEGGEGDVADAHGIDGGRRPAGGRLSEAASAGGQASGGWWATEPDVGRVADGVPDRVDRLSALGNALVPQIAEWIGQRIIECEGRMTESSHQGAG